MTKERRNTHPSVAVAVSLAGSPAELARKLVVSEAFISQLRSNGKPLPEKRAVQVAQLYGVPLKALRPDLFAKQV
jgi:DNA-binding transcriptional regulator YdaS (Cro superfamily)